MNIVHNGTFFNVGQGLFHYGSIASGADRANYIYDCGASRRSRLLNTCIDECVEMIPGNEKVLDVLILSHFHWDHISGLRRLLSRLTRIKKVIMPYFTPAERAFFMATTMDDVDYLENPSRWYPSFLRGPVTYLLSTGKIESINLLVGSGVGENDSDYGKEKYHDSHQSHIKDIKNLPPQLREQLLKFETSVQGRHAWDVDERTTFLKADGILRLNSYWHFRFFSWCPSMDKLADLHRRFMAIKGSQEMITILRDDVALRAIRSAYQGVFGIEYMNDSSLTMFAGIRVSDLVKEALRLEYCCSQEISTLHRMERAIHHPDLAGILFTGDFPLSDRDMWRRFINTMGLAEGRNDVVVYQVPHHGSRQNWSREQSGVSTQPIFVISASKNNSYGHPDASVLHSIAAAGRQTVWVNQQNRLSYELLFQ